MTLADVPRYADDRVSRRDGRAVVVGGGMAGLLAARVLADGFDRVTVVERDDLAAVHTARDGLPQAGHVHAMLEAGRATLEDLFPGYNAGVVAEGGLTIDAATDFDYFHEGGVLADGPVRLPMLCASRSLFEGVVRRRVHRIDNVDIRSPSRVVEYRESGGRIGGVTVRSGRQERVLDAGLVVDASGRASKTPGWLGENGYRTPPVDSVHIDLAYTSTVVERPTGDRRGYLVAPTPGLARGGTVVPIEGDRWLVTLFGMHGDHPPTDVAGFRSFAGSLPTPAIADLLSNHPPLIDDFAQYPFPDSRWHRYDALDDRPRGLLPLGDSIASFNPIYGQGMSVAALEALALHHALAAAGPDRLEAAYLDRVTDVVSTIWRLTATTDFRFPETTGSRPRGTGAVNWYFDRLVRTAHDDGDVSHALARVLRLEVAPTTLLAPGVLLRVLRP